MAQNLKAWIEPARDKWRIRYRDRYGKKQTAGHADSRDLAKQLLKKTQERLDLRLIGQCDDSRSARELYAQWVKECGAGTANKHGKMIKNRTIQIMYYSLKPFLAKLDLMGGDIGKADAETIKDFKAEWIERVADGEYAAWTAYRSLKDVKSFLSWCRRNEHIAWDPFSKTALQVPKPKPRYYTDEELLALENAAIELDDKGMLLAALLGYEAGLRRGEVLRAQLADLRWNVESDGAGELHLWDTETKTEQNRTVPLSFRIMALIPLVCGSRRTGQILKDWNISTLEYRWARLKHKAGIIDEGKRWKRYEWAKGKPQTEPDGELARFHDLRHTFCKLFLQRGGNLGTLRQITGHKSLQVLLNTYSHFETKHLHEGIRQMVNRPQNVEKVSNPEIISSDGEKSVGHPWGKVGQIWGSSANLDESREKYHDDATDKKQGDNKA